MDICTKGKKEQYAVRKCVEDVAEILVPGSGVMEPSVPTAV
jgi:hypothetical protein